MGKLFMWKRPSKTLHPESVEAALKYALWFLGLRFRGVEEMKKRLLEKGFEKKVADSTITKLKAMSYLGDSRLLEGLLVKYKERETYGRRYIAQKLAQRHFSPADIKRSLDENFLPKDELNAAKRLLDKESLDWQEDEKAKEKLMAKMQRRGFGLDVIFKVLK
jgi:regulatory protein